MLSWIFGRQVVTLARDDHGLPAELTRERSFVPSVWRKTGQFRICSVSVALGVLCGSVTSPTALLSAQDRALAAASLYTRMADGKQWTTRNLDVKTAESYCYENSETNCLQYGRLYTWESARQACQSLGNGWRLPKEEEWRQLAKRYGGVREDSDDSGSAAYQALLVEGDSGFSALLGGGRSEDGKYARVQAHGFYWTASENDPGTAWFYNFAQGSRSLNRQIGGEKQRAFSVRCVRE